MWCLYVLKSYRWVSRSETPWASARYRPHMVPLYHAVLMVYMSNSNCSIILKSNQQQLGANSQSLPRGTDGEALAHLSVHCDVSIDVALLGRRINDILFRLLPYGPIDPPYESSVITELSTRFQECQDPSNYNS